MIVMVHDEDANDEQSHQDTCQRFDHPGNRGANQSDCRGQESQGDPKMRPTAPTEFSSVELGVYIDFFRRAHSEP
jgi:hypothetical protein